MAVRSVRWRRVATTVLILTVAAAPGVAVAWASPAARPAGWSQIRTFRGPVWDIVSTGPRDTWLTGTTAATNVFVRRWNGASWRVVRTPSAMSSDDFPVIGASSATNAWVFTFTRPATAAQYPVGWHWTGRGWRSYRLAPGSSIGATTVFSSSDAWAFGTIGAGRPYVVRYDGHTWRPVHAPVEPTGVSARSRDDMWIVGPASASRSAYTAAHWTGTAWRTLKLPGLRVPKGMHAAAPQILATGPADIWVDLVLVSNSGQGPAAQALLHFDAGRWTQISAPRGSLFRSPDMAADGAGGVWLAVTAPASSRTVVHDYRHGHWSKAAVFAAPGRYTLIAALVRVPGTGAAWAGGYAGHTTGTPRTYGVLYQFRR